MSGAAVRCAIVGLGEMGRLHAGCIGATPGAVLAACCDPDARALEASPAGVYAFPTVEDALAECDLDAVIVCTPPDRHLGPVRSALAAGVHVLCEKPLATSLADVDALACLDELHPGRLAVGHVRRFDPRFLALRAALDAGSLGRPLQLSGLIACPRADADRLARSTTLALELAVHDVDAMRWLAGNVVRVYADAIDALPTPGPDAVVATLTFASGAVATVQYSWTMPDDAGIDFEFRFRIAGTGGVAEIDGRDRGVTILTPDRAPLHPDTYSWPLLQGGGVGGALLAQDTHFLARVRDERSWPLTVADARAAVLGALAIDTSIASGLPVAVTDAEAT